MSDFDPYNIDISHLSKLDPYRVADLFQLDPTIGQAVKKLLRSGSKHKTLRVDIREAITTLERREEMLAEDELPPTPQP